jgi:hypothetical protein
MCECEALSIFSKDSSYCVDSLHGVEYYFHLIQVFIDQSSKFKVHCRHYIRTFKPANSWSYWLGRRIHNHTKHGGCHVMKENHVLFTWWSYLPHNTKLLIVFFKDTVFGWLQIWILHIIHQFLLEFNSYYSWVWEKWVFLEDYHFLLVFYYY